MFRISYIVRDLERIPVLALLAVRFFLTGSPYGRERHR
jgi:hypothetical protein